MLTLHVTGGGRWKAALCSVGDCLCLLGGGESGTYVRGAAKVVAGRASIDLPEHFGMVTEQVGLTVQLTPRGKWLQLFIAELTTQRLTVHEEEGRDGEFDYLVQGFRRNGKHQVIRERSARADRLTAS